MKKMPAINQLVVINHELNATMWRVKELGKISVGLINAEIEDTHKNQTLYYVDISLLKSPSVGQLNQFNKI